MLCLPLTHDERTALASGIARVEQLTGSPRPFAIVALQAMYDGLLSGRDGIAEEALGMAFGEHLRRLGPYDWIALEDEHGREVSLGVVGFDLCCSPLSMIRNRLATGDHANLEALAAATIERLRNLATDYRNARAG